MSDKWITKGQMKNLIRSHCLDWVKEWKTPLGDPAGPGIDFNKACAAIDTLEPAPVCEDAVSRDAVEMAITVPIAKYYHPALYKKSALYQDQMRGIKDLPSVLPACSVTKPKAKEEKPEGKDEQKTN